MSDERTPEELLALAVIAQACMDLRARRGTPVYANAHNWLMSEEFEAVCAQADVCPIKVRRSMKKQELT